MMNEEEFGGPSNRRVAPPKPPAGLARCLQWAPRILILLSVLACSKPAPVQDEFRYGFTSEPSTFDPIDPANTADGRSILFNIFEGLVKPDTGGGLLPAMAESWEITGQGRVYTFTLRPGIRFHDGSAMQASDVEFTLNQAIKAGFTGFAQIESAAAAPDGKMQVILKEPDPEFLSYLTIGIVPEANADRQGKAVGTGPFMVESYAPQRSLVLRKYPGYWQQGLPSLERVTIVFIADSDALLLALQGGSVDAAGVPGGLIPQLDLDRFEAIPDYSDMVHLMALNNAQPPLDDKRVRQAINYAVDPQEIIDAAFYGQGAPSGSPLIPGLARYYESSLANPYPVNLERARSLLAEAGYPQGLPAPLEIAVPANYTMHVDTAQVIVNQLERIGVKANIRLVEWASWIADVYQGRRYTATIISLDAVTASPRSFLARYRSNAGSNFLNFKSDEFDRVYDLAQHELDEDRRAALYREAQRIISDEAAAVYIQDILGFKVFPKGRFEGVLNYPLYVVDFAPLRRTVAGGTN